MLATLLKNKNRSKALTKTYDGITADFSRQAIYSLDSTIAVFNSDLLKRQIHGMLSGVQLGKDMAKRL
jgi:hypothetical protein